MTVLSTHQSHWCNASSPVGRASELVTRLERVRESHPSEIQFPLTLAPPWSIEKLEPDTVITGRNPRSVLIDQEVRSSSSISADLSAH